MNEDGENTVSDEEYTHGPASVEDATTHSLDKDSIYGQDNTFGETGDGKGSDEKLVENVGLFHEGIIAKWLTKKARTPSRCAPEIYDHRQPSDEHVGVRATKCIAGMYTPHVPRI